MTLPSGLVLVAAGRGVRLGAKVPKAWVPLGGVPLFAHAFSAFHDLPWIRRIVVVMEPAWVGRARRLLRSLGADKVSAVVPGGSRRQDSVVRGVRALNRNGLRAVLIHDCARPFVDASVAARVAREAVRHGAALAALPVADTVKRAGTGGLVASTVARDGLWLAQTPQGVRVDLVPRWLAALEAGGVTDDVQALEAMGQRVKLVPGSRRSAKVTVREDLEAAEALRGGEREQRTGLGFDLHRLVPGRPLVLGGVRIAFPRGLDGHSDADLISHALTDAVLGATGGGDIGTRFGVRRIATRNARSLDFLHDVVHEAMHKGYAISSADVTLLAEAPKIGPSRRRIIGNLARVMHVPPERVSLKATTFKRTGSIGRAEAMACVALVTAESA